MTTVNLVESVGSRHYYVVTSQSKMPSSVKSSYRHSAVILVDGEPVAPKIIRSTSRQTVLCDSGPGYSGRTSRCAAERDSARMWGLAREYAAGQRARE